MKLTTDELIQRAKDCVAMADPKGLQVSGPNIKVTAFYEAPALLEEAVAHLERLAAGPELLAALEAAVECGMVPSSSATEGGAMAYVKHAHVADQIRSAIAKAKGGKA